MTVQFTCTGPGLPTWYVNGRVAVSNENCSTLTIRRAAGMNATAILTISGNQTCDTFNIYCGIVVSESQLLYPRNISLMFQGLLQVSFSVPAAASVFMVSCISHYTDNAIYTILSPQVIFLHLKIFTSMSRLTPQTLDQS